MMKLGGGDHGRKDINFSKIQSLNVKIPLIKRPSTAKAPANSAYLLHF
jgi:hypothetical protein